MFFVKSVQVVGRNCDVSAQVLPEIGGLYRIEVNIPISSFSSGEADRDNDVRKILKADVKPNLVFRSKAMTAEEWQTLFAKKAFDLEGEMTIGEKTYPLKVSSNYLEKEDGPEVDGVAKANFDDFEIKPPKLGGGAIVKTKKQIELDFHLLASRILGADSLKPVKK